MVPTGLLLTTYGMITLALEASRLAPGRAAMVLPLFLGIAGVSQLVCPLAGYLSDRSGGSSLSRRRPFILYGSLALTVSLCGQWLTSRCEWNAGLYALFFGISMVSINFAYTATTSLVPDLVPSPQTGLANGILSLSQVLGAFCGFLFFFVVGNLDALYFFYVVAVVLGACVTLLGAASSHTSSRVEESPGEFSWKTLHECYYVSPSDPKTADFAFVFVSRTLYYMGGSTQAFLQYYIRDRMLPPFPDSPLASIMPVDDPARAVCAVAVVGYVAGLVAAVPAGSLSDKFGRKPVVVFACVLMSIAVVALGGMRSAEPADILLWSLVGGLGNGAYQAVDLAIAVDTLPDPAESARYMGIWGVGAFIGACFGPVLGAPLLYFFGRFHNDDPVAIAPQGYLALFLFAACCLFASAAILVAFVKKAR